jgi:hypothetical protein
MENKKIIVFVLLAVVVGWMPFFMPAGFLWVISALVVPAILGMCWLYGSRDNSQEYEAVRNVFMWGFFVRTAVCCVLVWLASMKTGDVYFLHADDYGFGLNASRILDVWKSTGMVPQPGTLDWMGAAGDLTVPYWLSYVYYFIGEYPLLPIALNCSLGAVSIILIYCIGRYYLNHRIALFVAWLFALWPSLVLWSTQNLRESVIIFCTLLFILCVFELRSRGNAFWTWFGLVISFLILYKMRSHVAVLLVIAGFLSFFCFSGKKKFMIAIVVLGVFTVLFAANVFHIRSILCSKLALRFSSLFETLNYHHHVKQYYADTAYLTDADISKPFNFFVYLPAFLAYIFFSPFPWEVTKFSQIPGVVEMVIWFFLSFFALKGALWLLFHKTRDFSVIFIFVFATVIILIGEGNVGTLFRHRDALWPFLFIFTAVGFLPESCQRNETIRRSRT